MLEKFLPAVTVAAQNLQGIVNARNEHGHAKKVGHKGPAVTTHTKGPTNSNSPFASAGSHHPKKHLTTAKSLFASGSPGSTVANPLAASPVEGAESNHNPKSKPIFSDLDKMMINVGKKVYVAGFSSQGGGHTERMLAPLGIAAEKGDTVVLALPPHWEVDTGNEQKKLDQFSAEYRKRGVNVVTVQADKAVWGFYKPNGPSDNFRILEEFANKSRRDNESIPLYGSATEKGQGFKHRDIVQEVVDIVGKEEMSKIKVFEDMDPYLGKAATKAGIAKDHIVGQSNHVLLLDAEDYFGDRSDAFLVKVIGNGHNGQMATIDIDPTINRTLALGATLDNLGVAADHKAVDVRKDMVAKLMDFGNIHDLNSPEPVSMKGAVLVSPEATKDSIDRGVYTYLNKYTDPLAQHIISRLKGEGDTPPSLHEVYKKTLFVVCGAETVAQNTPGSNNAMHIAQAGNFAGVAAGGFGTMTETADLLENNGYHSNFLLMPVEQQHEQEANAFVLLPAALSEGNKDRVDSAMNIDELKSKFDDVVLSGAITNKGLGDTTMEPLVRSTHRDGEGGADKAARFLKGIEPGMNDNDARLLEENNWRAQEAGRKEMRQLNKVMIPVLEAMFRGESEAKIRLSTSVDERTVNVEKLVNSLSNPAKLRELTGVSITNQGSRNMSNVLAKDLKKIIEQPEGPERQVMADQYRRGEYANNKFILGY